MIFFAKEHNMTVLVLTIGVSFFDKTNIGFFHSRIEEGTNNNIINFEYGIERH